MKAFAGKVLIIVQNLPVPLDRRVWLEARTLHKNRYQVSVICPKSKEYPRAHEVIDGIAIYRYRIPFDAHSPLTYAMEFIYAWLATAWLSVRVLLRDGFDVIHACNPPDTFFLLGSFYKLIGKEFLFDHHDLSPEMFTAKFHGRKGFMYRCLILLEKLTMRTARVVLSTNESYRQIAIKRGRKNPADIFVVRSGPDLEQIKPVEADDSLKRGFRYLVCYLGEMCPQDGVDYLLRATHFVKNVLKRKDVGFALIGGGPAVPMLKDLAKTMGLTDVLWFTDRLSDELLSRYLSTADVCVDPDPWSEWANNSTMNKILEYMAFAKPIVAFDLKEIRNSARRAAVYVPPNNVRLFAEKIVYLLDHPELRQEMGEYGQRRILTQLAWQHTSPPLLAAYAKIFQRCSNEDKCIDQQIKTSLRQIQFDPKMTLVD